MPVIYLDRAKLLMKSAFNTSKPSTSEMRECRKCGKVKPLKSGFHKKDTGVGGHARICRVCLNTHTRERRRSLSKFDPETRQRITQELLDKKRAEIEERKRAQLTDPDSPLQCVTCKRMLPFSKFMRRRNNVRGFSMSCIACITTARNARTPPPPPPRPKPVAKPKRPVRVPDNTQFCTRCRVEKPLKEFYMATPAIYAAICRMCDEERRKKAEAKEARKRSDPGGSVATSPYAVALELRQMQAASRSWNEPGAPIRAELSPGASKYLKAFKSG
jgi:hypothetical protein